MMNEMPLVIFTVLSQLAVGGMITLSIMHLLKKNINNRTAEWISFSLAGITGISLLASLLHLGHPLEAYRAITHFGVSWLSREVVLFSVFFGGISLYALTWRRIKVRQSSRTLIGAITSVVGLLAVISSALIYMLPAIPAWNNASPILFFLFTTILVGPMYIGVMVSWLEKKSVRLEFFIGIVAIAYAIVFIIYLSMLSIGGMALELTAKNIIENSMFWVRGILSWALPMVYLAFMFFNKQKPIKQNLAMIVVLFLLVVTGEIIGRELFYSTAVELEIGQYYK